LLCENCYYDENIIPFDTFIEYAQNKGIEYTEIEDYHDYYQNLMPLEENLACLKDHIDFRYNT